MMLMHGDQPDVTAFNVEVVIKCSRFCRHSASGSIPCCWPLATPRVNVNGHKI
jgi:hypothetical protein